MRALPVMVLSLIMFSVSCTSSGTTAEGTGESSGGGWVLLVFLLIPLGVLGLLIYRYWTSPEPIVWTDEDIENYNRQKAEELGEEYVGQDYTEVEEEPAPKKRYQVIWENIRNFRSKRRLQKELEEIEYELHMYRMKEAERLMKIYGLPDSKETYEEEVVPKKNGNRKVEELEETEDEFDLDGIDIDALLEE